MHVDDCTTSDKSSVHEGRASRSTGGTDMTSGVMRWLRPAATVPLAVWMWGAVELSALTIPLDHQRVPTSIEGVQVDLFVTGPVHVQVTDGTAHIEIDRTVDLSDVQKHFAAIAQARAVDVRCGTSVSLEQATLRTLDVRGSTIAEVVSTATIRKTRCGADGASVTHTNTTTGVLALHIAMRVSDDQRLVFDVTAADKTAGSVAALMTEPATSALVSSMIGGSLSSALGPGSVTAPLSRDAASYDPRVKTATFRPLPGQVLGAHLVVTLRVPLVKFFEWNIGD